LFGSLVDTVFLVATFANDNQTLIYSAFLKEKGVQKERLRIV
jgi:hypothetical protein